MKIHSDKNFIKSNSNDVKTFFRNIFEKMISLDRSSLIILGLIILIAAAFLRFYQLGSVPHGMTWDEAAIGYNGYAIFHTRRDEWLTKLPISFKSFGDYKSPLAIYLNGPFTYLFGMNVWAVRLPFALAGLGAVLGMMALGYQLTKSSFSERFARTFGLGLGLLMALSPWAIHYSRIGFESGIALTFVIWAVVCLLAFFNAKRASGKLELSRQIGLLLAAVFFSAASFYSYHSAKIVFPLLLLSIVILYWPKIKEKFYLIIGGLGFGLILLLPLLKDTFWGNGGNRFLQATVFGQHLPSPNLVQTILHNFLIHFSPNFLILGETINLRQGDGHWGVLFITEFLLCLISLLFFIIKSVRFFGNLARKQDFHFPNWREMLFAISWIFIGIIPAAIGTDVPHSNRGLLALPGFLLLAAFGFNYLLKYLASTTLDKQVSGSKGESHLLVKSVTGMFVLVHFFLLFSYVHNYYTVYAKQSAFDFQDGYIQAFQFAVKNEANVNQILISDSYGQAYIFALFVRKTNPIWYQGGIMVKYVYLPKLSEADLQRKNVVLIATPDQIPPKDADELVYGSDGQIKFVLVKTK